MPLWVWIEAGQKEQLFKASDLSELSLAHDAYHANAHEIYALYQRAEHARASRGLAVLIRPTKECCLPLSPVRLKN